MENSDISYIEILSYDQFDDSNFNSPDSDNRNRSLFISISLAVVSFVLLRPSSAFAQEVANEALGIAQPGFVPGAVVLPLPPTPWAILTKFHTFNDFKVFLDPTVSKYEKLVLGGKYTCCTGALLFGQIAHLIPAGYRVKDVLNICCTSSWAGYTALHRIQPKSISFKKDF